MCKFKMLILLVLFLMFCSMLMSCTPLRIVKPLTYSEYITPTQHHRSYSLFKKCKESGKCVYAEVEAE